MKYLFLYLLLSLNILATGYISFRFYKDSQPPEVTVDVYQMLSQITLTEPGIDGKVKAALKNDGKITFDELDGIMEIEKARFRSKLLR